MSNRRRLIALVATLGGLVALYLFGQLALSPQRSWPLFPRFRADLASSITIEGGGLEIRLRRGVEDHGPSDDRVASSQSGGTAGGRSDERSDRWWVTIGGERYPADGSHVRGLLGALQRAEAVRVASRDPKTWGNFLLEAGQAMHLRVDAGRSASAGKAGSEGAEGSRASAAGREAAAAIDAFVGGTTPTGSGDYLRLSGNPTVFVTSAPISAYLTRAASWWSDLRILPRGLSPDSLQEIGIRARDFRVGSQRVTDDYLLVSTLSGGGAHWSVEGRSGYRIDPKRLLELEGELLGLTGERFAPGADQKVTGLDAPVAEVLVVDVQGRRWLIKVGRRDGSSFFVQRQDRPYVYLVNQYALRSLIRGLPELTGEPPHPPR